MITRQFATYSSRFFRSLNKYPIRKTNSVNFNFSGLRKYSSQVTTYNYSKKEEYIDMDTLNLHSFHKAVKPVEPILSFKSDLIGSCPEALGLLFGCGIGSFFLLDHEQLIELLKYSAIGFGLFNLDLAWLVYKTLKSDRTIFRNFYYDPKTKTLSAEPIPAPIKGFSLHNPLTDFSRLNKGLISAVLHNNTAMARNFLRLGANVYAKYNSNFIDDDVYYFIGDKISYKITFSIIDLVLEFGSEKMLDVVLDHVSRSELTSIYEQVYKNNDTRNAKIILKRLNANDISDEASLEFAKQVMSS